MLLPNIEIIVGTYEEYLLGYQLIQPTGDDADKAVLVKQTFADKSHAGSIRCVAVQGPWIATGGSDDRIFVYDMRTRKQSQIVLAHSGTVNTLVFSPDLTHLLSGSDDGHMIATRVTNWETEGDWRKAHAGTAVTHISCHPSSKLALSLGGNQVLHTWNLMKGRVAYKTNLKSKHTLGNAPDCLSWSPDGAYFTLSGPLVLEIWDIKTAGVARRETTVAKPICVAWLNGRECVTGLENGSIVWISLNVEAKTIAAHAERVKAISFLNCTLVTVSSAGEIKVWTCSVQEKRLTLLATTNIDCRPTCMGLLDLAQLGVKSMPQPSSDTPKGTPRQQQQQQLAATPASLAYVSIKYDDDKADNKDAEDEVKQTPIRTKATKAKLTNDSKDKNDSEQSDDSFSGSSDDSDSASASSDSSEKRPPQRKRKQTVQVAPKRPKAKQTKKK